jgi:hypothetical protein
MYLLFSSVLPMAIVTKVSAGVSTQPKRACDDWPRRSVPRLDERCARLKEPK